MMKLTVLKNYLKKRKTTSCALAKDLGIKPAYLSQIMGGHRRCSRYLALAITVYTKGEIQPLDLRPDDSE